MVAVPRERLTWLVRVLPWGAGAIALTGSCHYDPAYRDVPEPLTSTCTVGAIRCSGDSLQTCVGDPHVQSWQLTTDCHATGLVCAPSLQSCATCTPGALDCQAETVVTCDPAGKTWQQTQTCDTTQGFACRLGACTQLCQQAASEQSNVGCEYFAADLDNAVISPSLNAAAQQYAIVVSNVQADVPASVTVREDDSLPGDPAHQERVVGTAVIAPQNLEVFKLGPREVDGSPDGTFNTGTGTALTRHAYRITSDYPITAYQFNPLDNVNVFSNDASQLLPVAALGATGAPAYVIAGWPQTIAITDDPATNFGTNLRAFVAIIATSDDTHVTFHTTARVIAGGPFSDGLAVGSEGTATLQQYEILNLETGDFNADFTGSTVDTDRPVVVFPGSEASDAPDYQTIADRFCCADHLEHQETPVRSVGKQYALAKMPNRTTAVIAAGGDIGEVIETEYYRVVAVQTGVTSVSTSLPAPWSNFTLNGRGQSQTIPSKTDFTLTASQPVIVLDITAGQDAGGVPQGLPGGDPSLPNVAPIEQWRSDYVLLTPDKYVFDYLVIVAPNGSHVYVDALALDSTNSDVTPTDGLTEVARGSAAPPYWTYRYQLSYPVIDPTQQPPNNILPGKQNDGVHHIQSDAPVGVMAYGFDSYVSYAYAGGTQLTVINPQ
jgi:hypothetical protein